MAAIGGAVERPAPVLVVVGGWEEGTVEVYDPAEKSWSPLIPLPTRRAFHASAVLLNTLLTPRFIFGLAAFNRKLVAVGGLTDQGEYNVVEEKPLATTEAYDPGANQWSADLVPPLPVPARGLATAMLNGDLYVVAGKLACRLEAGGKAWELITPPVMNT
eukprot:gene26482-6872_t